MRQVFYCEIKFSNSHEETLIIKKGFYCKQKELEGKVMVFVEELREHEYFKRMYFDGYDVINIA